MTLLLGTIKATTEPVTLNDQLLEDVHNPERPELLAFIGKPTLTPSDWEYGLAIMHVLRDAEGEGVYADVELSWIAR